MVRLIIKTDKDVHKILKLAFKKAQSEDKWDVFYRTHPGFVKYLTGNNPYTMDADLVNLRMMEILEHMDCECWFEGGLPNVYDTEPDKTDWKLFMEV